jgi:hypothetical protein
VIQRLPYLSSGEHGYPDSSSFDSARTGTSHKISSAAFDLHPCPMAPGGGHQDALAGFREVLA